MKEGKMKARVTRGASALLAATMVIPLASALTEMPGSSSKTVVRAAGDFAKTIDNTSLSTHKIAHPVVNTSLDEEWKGNDLIFKTYVKGAENGDGKRPAEKVKDRDFIRTFEDASHYTSFGAILNQEYIDVSFDDTQMYDRFLDMAEANDWRFLALPSTHGGHTYWKKPATVPKSGKDKKTALVFGVICAWSSSFVSLKLFSAFKGITTALPPHISMSGI